MKFCLYNRSQGTQWSKRQTIKERVAGTLQLPGSSLRDRGTVNTAHIPITFFVPRTCPGVNPELDAGYGCHYEDDSHESDRM